jgi:hypothetical protein
MNSAAATTIAKGIHRDRILGADEEGAIIVGSSPPTPASA